MINFSTNIDNSSLTLKINHTFGLKNRGGVIFRGKRMGFFILLFHFYYTTKIFPMNAFLKSPALIMANKQKKGPGQTGQTTSFSWKREVKWAEPTFGLQSDHVPWTRPNSIHGECRTGTTWRYPSAISTVQTYFERFGFIPPLSLPSPTTLPPLFLSLKSELSAEISDEVSHVWYPSGKQKLLIHGTLKEL